MKWFEPAPLLLTIGLSMAYAASSTLRAETILQPGGFVAAGGGSITEIRRYSVFLEDYFLMCSPMKICG